MSAHLSDMDLFAAFHRGEEAAVRKVYNLHFEPLCIFAHRITGEMQDAEDVVSESFVKLLHKRKEFQSLKNVKDFLYLVTRNGCIDYLRSKKRHHADHRQLQFLNASDEENIDLFNEELLRLEVLAAIHAEIENLPDRCREIFKLIFIEGLSTEQIAGRLELSPNTVRHQKNRALSIIRAELLKKNLLPALLYLAILFPSETITV